jgi:hypothetical protein
MTSVIESPVQLVVPETTHQVIGPTEAKPQQDQIQALLLRSAHFIVHALSQDVRFRQEGKAITDELGAVMDALRIHYEDCGCGCKGR